VSDKIARRYQAERCGSIVTEPEKFIALQHIFESV